MAGEVTSQRNKNKKLLFIIGAAVAFVGISTSNPAHSQVDHGKDNKTKKRVTSIDSSENTSHRINKGDTTIFIHAKGRHLVRGGRRIILKGVSFSNNYAADLNKFDLLDSNHHADLDFQRVAEMGMNSIRFAFNANWYEQKPDDFWEWLDRNIQLARKYGIYLILDMHVPIGGFWLDPTSVNVDFRLWTDPHVKKRNLSLWEAIATRYKDEEYVAAYNILNEPVTTDQTGEQWQALAQEIINAIRAIDKNHLIIVDKLYGVNKSYGSGNVKNQFLVNDTNVMYDFHFYEPIAYTHQYASWVVPPMGDGGKYPDPNIVLPTGKQVLIESSRNKSPNIVSGTSEWSEYKSGLIKISDGKINKAIPIIVIRGVMKGKVYFDNFRVIEYDATGRMTREVLREPLSAKTIGQWWQWKWPKSNSSYATFERVETDGYHDSYSLSISNTGGENSVLGWSSDSRWFKVKNGYQYQIAGYMKGVGVKFQSDGEQAKVGFEMDFYREPDGTGEKGFVVRDREYLEQEFMKLFQFGIDNNVPMSVMEFGLVRQCFEMPGKGGSKWLADVLDIFHKKNVSFAYWNYHGPRMGMYLSDSNTVPRNPNTELIRTFKQKIKEW